MRHQVVATGVLAILVMLVTTGILFAAGGQGGDSPGAGDKSPSGGGPSDVGGNRHGGDNQKDGTGGNSSTTTALAADDIDCNGRPSNGTSQDCLPREAAESPSGPVSIIGGGTGSLQSVDNAEQPWWFYSVFDDLAEREHAEHAGKLSQWKGWSQISTYV